MQGSAESAGTLGIVGSLHVGLLGYWQEPEMHRLTSVVSLSRLYYSMLIETSSSLDLGAAIPSQ